MAALKNSLSRSASTVHICMFQDIKITSVLHCEFKHVCDGLKTTGRSLVHIWKIYMELNFYRVLQKTGCGASRVSFVSVLGVRELMRMEHAFGINYIVNITMCRVRDR
jgi:hypothetical protein